MIKNEIRDDIIAKWNSLSTEKKDILSMEEWAYSMGIQAYTFALPLTIFERERRIRLDKELLAEQQDVAPVAPINQIGHMEDLATADDILPYTPNNDTVYSGALLELIDEPIILTAPNILDRYWSIEVADAYTENRFYIGTRATGGFGGHHAFIGPGWTGTLPKDVTPHRLPYNSIMFALRIAVDPGSGHDQDLPEVHKLQKQFSLTSLSNWQQGYMGQAAVPKSITLDTRPSYDGPLAFFKTIADLLIENPPTEQHYAGVVPFKYIGIILGEPFDPESIPKPMRDGLARAVIAGEQLMKWKVKYRGTPYETRWNNLREGTYNYDYLDRAVGSLEGLFVHDYEEALYFSTYECYKDGEGELLNSNEQYVMHFDADQIPETLPGGFWSLTMYGSDFQLVKNDLDRFSIGDRTSSLSKNEDGSLDIYVQSKVPQEGSDNWLPCSDDPEPQLFRINYRIYLPSSKVLNNRAQYIPPIIKRS